MQFIVAQRKALAAYWDIFWDIYKASWITMDGLSLAAAAIGAGALTKAEQQGSPQKEEERKEEVCQSSITQQWT